MRRAVEICKSTTLTSGSSGQITRRAIYKPTRHIAINIMSLGVQERERERTGFSLSARACDFLRS